MTLSANTTDTGPTIDESSPGTSEMSRTFLFTDVEGSTRLWEQSPAAMRRRSRGTTRSSAPRSTRRTAAVVKTTGDGLMAVFDRPLAAVNAGDRRPARADHGAVAGPVRHPGPDGHPHGRGRVARRRLLRSGRQPDGADHGGRSWRPDPPVRGDRAARRRAAFRTASGCATSASTGSRTWAGRSACSRSATRRCRRSSRRSRPSTCGRTTSRPRRRRSSAGRPSCTTIRDRLDDADVRLAHAHRPGRHRQDAAGDPRRGRPDRPVPRRRLLRRPHHRDATPTRVLALIGGGGRPRRDRRSLAARRAPAPAPRPASPARPRQLRAGDGRRAESSSSCSRDCPSLEAARHEPRGAPGPRRARHLGAAADAAGSRPPARRPRAGAEPVRGDPAVRRAGARRPVRLPPDRRQRRRRRRDLPPARRAAARDRARDRPPEPVLAGGAARSARRAASRRSAAGPATCRPASRPSGRRSSGATSSSSPAEQRLFELLSVFAGGSVEAVEAVAAGLDEAAGTQLDALDGLGSLLDKSLISAARRDRRRPDAARRDAQDDQGIRGGAARRPAGLRGRGSRGARPLLRPAGGRRSTPSARRRRRGAMRADRLAARSTTSGSPGGTRSLTRDLVAALGAARRAVAVLRRARLVSRDDRADQRPSRRRSGDAGQPRSLADGGRSSGRRLARAMTLLRGYTRRGRGRLSRPRYTIIKEHGDVPQFFPVLRNLGELPRVPRRVREGHPLRERDPAARRDRGRRRACGSRATDARSQHGVQRAPRGRARLPRRSASATFESGGFRPRQLRFGIDPRVSCPDDVGVLPVAPGLPDRAVERADRAVSLATEIDHPYSLAYAFYHSGFLHLWRREAEIVRDRAAAALRVADDDASLPVWRALATCLLGAATSALGQPDEGLRQMADGIDQYHGLRTPPVFWPMIRFMQAGAHVDAAGAGARHPVDRRGLAIARRRRRARATPPHRPRRPVAARPGRRAGRRGRVLRACLAGGLRSAPGCRSSGRPSGCAVRDRKRNEPTGSRRSVPSTRPSRRARRPRISGTRATSWPAAG